MRMRKKKHGKERFEACSEFVAVKPQKPIENARDVFTDGGELHLEIGCGKGAFACGMAKKHPDVKFIAMEKFFDALVIAAERAVGMAEELCGNLLYANADAKDLQEWFAPDSVDTLYLNFSDPWPKKGHCKRRLTYREFLKQYFIIIKNGGKLRFKTDNRPLFDFTLDELRALGFTPDIVTYDLHASEYNADNIVTEYEQNFSQKGFKINMLVLTVRK